MRPHLYNVRVQYGGVSLPCDDMRDAAGVLDFIFAKRNRARALKAQKFGMRVFSTPENIQALKIVLRDGNYPTPKKRFVSYAR